MEAAEETTPDALVSVTIIDDHGFFLDGVAQLIEGFVGYRVPYTALNGRAFIQRHGHEAPTTIALVDMCMPVMDGAETIQWLRANWPKTMVLAMSFERGPEMMRKAILAGAHGFIPKGAGGHELQEAFERVCRKGSYFNDELLREHLALTDAKLPETVNLTVPEREVLDAVCAPDEPKWELVADRTNKGLPTVHSHRVSLFTKTGTISKAGLVSYGRANGYGKGQFSA